jgi:hypothetical protein
MAVFGLPIDNKILSAKMVLKGRGEQKITIYNLWYTISKNSKVAI